jgi:[ribosomal protein S5]-alanine N-acetyltransferase
MTDLPFRLPPSPPVLSDDVVHLRLVTLLDTDLLVSGSRNAEVVRWTFLPAGLDTARAAELLRRWQLMVGEGRMRQYAVGVGGGDDAAVGLVSLILQDADDPRCADVAYWLLPQARGRGLATHAVRLLLEWGYGSAGCTSAALHTMEGNVASEAVARRTGLDMVGRRTWNHGGRRVDLRRWVQAAPSR